MPRKTTPTPRLPATTNQRRAALARLSAAEQLAAIRRGDFTLEKWSATLPLSGRSPKRLELLSLLSLDEQLDALRDGRFSLSEWCAFSRRRPHHVAFVGGEFAFIALSTPEWCER